MAIHVSQQYNWQRFAKLIRWNLTFIIALSLIFIVAVSSIGLREKGWSGIISHPIGLGCMSALNVPLWLFDYNKFSVKGWFRFLVIGLSLVATFFSNSATALFILIACIGLFVWFELTRFDVRTKLSILIFSAAISIVLFFLVTENIADILAIFGKNPSLTGRTDFWDQLIVKVLERPILGYGIDGFWQPWRGDLNPAIDIRLPYFVPTHSHNGYIETVLYLGLSGLIFLLVTHVSNLLKLFHDFLGKSKAKTTFLACTLFVFLILFNIGSPGFLEAKDVWFLYVYLTVKLASPDLSLNHYLA
jgi:O-antigen ligase